MNDQPLTLDHVYKANYILRDVVRRTDVLYAPKLRPGTELYLKTENLQVTGSFKIRGAYYKMSQLSAGRRPHLQGGGHPGLRRGHLPGGGRLRRRLPEGPAAPG